MFVWKSCQVGHIFHLLGIVRSSCWVSHITKKPLDSLKAQFTKSSSYFTGEHFNLGPWLVMLHPKTYQLRYGSAGSYEPSAPALDNFGHGFGHTQQHAAVKLWHRLVWTCEPMANNLVFFFLGWLHIFSDSLCTSACHIRCMTDFMGKCW